MNTALGEMIEELRSAAGLSQRKLARRLDVDPSYLSRLERGERDPSIAFLRKFARETSAPIGLLIAGALMPEIPEDQREAYDTVIGKLLELAKTRQTELDLNSPS